MNRSPSSGDPKRPVAEEVKVSAADLATLTTINSFQAPHLRSGIHQPVPGGDNTFFVTQQGHVHGQEKFGTRAGSIWGRGEQSSNSLASVAMLAHSDELLEDEPPQLWDRAFQDAYSLPVVDEQLMNDLNEFSPAHAEYAEKKKLFDDAAEQLETRRKIQIRAVVSEFQTAALHGVERLIEERNFDRRSQTVRPLHHRDLPQVFIHRNIFYHSLSEEMYKDQYGDYAHKIAESELKNLRTLYDKRIPSLHVPLCGIISSCGFKYFVSAVVHGLHENRRIYGIRGDGEYFVKLTSAAGSSSSSKELSITQASGSQAVTALREISATFGFTEPDLLKPDDDDLPSFLDAPDRSRSPGLQQPTWATVKVIGSPNLSLFSFPAETNNSASELEGTTSCDHINGGQQGGGKLPSDSRNERIYCFNTSECLPAVSTEKLTPLNSVLGISAAGGEQHGATTTARKGGVFKKPPPRFLPSALRLYPGPAIPTSAGAPWETKEEGKTVANATEWVTIDQVQVVADLLRCWPVEEEKEKGGGAKLTGPLLKEVLHLHGINLCFMGAVYRCLMSETRTEIEARNDGAALKAFFPKVPSEDERLMVFSKKAPVRRHGLGEPAGGTKASMNRDETSHDPTYVPPIIGLGAQGLGGGPMVLKPSSKFEDAPVPSPFLPHSPEAKNTAPCIGERSTRQTSVRDGANKVDAASGPSSPLSPRVAQLDKNPQVLSPAPPPPTLSDHAPSTARSMRGTKYHQHQGGGAATARNPRVGGGGVSQAATQQQTMQDDPNINVPLTPIEMIPAKITLRDDGEVLTTLRIEMIARAFRAVFEEQLRGVVAPKREEKSSTPQKRKRTDTTALVSQNASSPASQVSRLLSELKALEDICLSEQSPQARTVNGRTFSRSGAGSSEVSKIVSSPSRMEKSQVIPTSPATTTGRAVAVSSILSANRVYCRDEETRFLGLSEPTVGDCARDRAVLLLNRLLGNDRGSQYFWQSVLLPEAWSRYQDLGSREHFLKLPRDRLCERVCNLCEIQLSERAQKIDASSSSSTPNSLMLTADDIIGIKPRVKSLLKNNDDFDLSQFLPSPEKRTNNNTNNNNNNKNVDSPLSRGGGVQILHTLEKVVEFSRAFTKANTKKSTSSSQAAIAPKPLEMTPRSKLFGKDIPASQGGDGQTYNLPRTEKSLLAKLKAAETKSRDEKEESGRVVDHLTDVATTLRELISLYTYAGAAFETDLCLTKKKLQATEAQITLQSLKAIWKQRGLDGPVYILSRGGIFINPSQASEHASGSATVEKIVDKDPTAMLKTLPILSGTPDRKPVDFRRVVKKLEEEWSKPPASPNQPQSSSDYILIPQHQCFKCGQLVRSYSLPEHKCEVITEHRHIDRGIHPIGLGSGSLPDDHLTASSCARGTKPCFARLGLGAPRGWQPKTCSVEKEWIQVRLPKKQTVHALAVSGDRCGRYPRYFILEHSLDGVVWQRYKSPYKHWETPVLSTTTDGKYSGSAAASPTIEPPIAATSTASLMFTSPEETLSKVRRSSHAAGGRLSLSSEEKELLLINAHHMDNPKTQRNIGQAPSWQRNRAGEDFHLGQLLIPVKVVDEQENAHLPSMKGGQPREKITEKRVPCALAGCTSANTISFNELRVPVDANYVRLLIGSDASMADDPNAGMNTGGTSSTTTTATGDDENGGVGAPADQNRVAVTLEIFCADINPIEPKAVNTRWSEQIPLRCVDWQRPVAESSQGTRLDFAKSELALLRQIIQLEARIEKTGGTKAKLITELQEANHTWKNLLSSWGAERQGDLDKQKKLNRKRPQ